MWVEVMCANFLVHKYLVLFLHLLADGEIPKDLEEIDAKKIEVWISGWLLALSVLYGPARDIQKNRK